MDRRRFLLSGAAAAAGAVWLAACRAAGHPAATAHTKGSPGSTSTTAPGGSSTSPVSSAGGDPTASSVSGPARFIQRGPADSHAIALTFHGSGDVALTRQMLDITRRLNVPITVFAVGTWLEANPGLAHELLAAGHELANHTYTHPVIGRLGRAAVDTEITRCRDALRTHTGSGGRWFRPSGMDVATPLVLDEAGKAGYATVVGYSVDTHDYMDPGVSVIESRFAAGLAPGAIVSLHLGHAGTLTAMEPMVNKARAAGLRPVTVSELLGAR
jgi:peptidoglycan/xylan/chitin deacetylase (PgdA/CDA1 family)